MGEKTRGWEREREKREMRDRGGRKRAFLHGDMMRPKRQTTLERCRRERQPTCRCRGKAAPGGLPNRVQGSKHKIQM